MQGYEALRSSAAWFDLSVRGRIRATGEDGVRLLHALATNHIQQLTPGAGCYTLFLNAQGRILGDANVLCLEDAFLIDTEPEIGRKLYEHIDRYIIADDVTLEDATSSAATIAVEGPDAAAVLQQLGAPVPASAYSWTSWDGRTVAALSRTGQPGYWIIGPREILHAPEIPQADPEAVHAVRVENARPRYGEDLFEISLPQETQLTHALHFNKGCYLGQEIVERIRSRGHVNRLLVQLRINSAEAPASGTKIMFAGSPVGDVTSSTFSYARNEAIALGYVRADVARSGATVEVDGCPATVAANPR